MAGKNRSGFLFMFIILILLGIIIYAYKEKFQVLYDTSLFKSKDLIKKYYPKKNIENSKKEVLEKINLMEKQQTQETHNSPPIQIDNHITQPTPTIEKNKTVRKQTKQDRDSTQIEVDSNQKNNQNISNHLKKPPEKNTLKSRPSKLYFTTIENESLKLISVKRDIYFDNTPLTETLKSLLNGPSQKEQTSSLIITNIPRNTRLLSVWIKENTAFINFSKEFEYNSYGKESTMAQLKQIVYTTTEFSNIQYVQILIEGKTKTYLGGEGIIINRPFSRNDFT